jgi:hypothetical protein
VRRVFRAHSEMAAFAFAPLFLASVFATGAHFLSKNAYPNDTTAEAIVRRAELALAKCRKGFTSETDTKQIRFEVDVLQSMMVSVPEDYRDTAKRAIEQVVGELTSQSHTFFSNQLMSEARSIVSALSESGMNEDEVAKLRTRLQAVSANMNNLPVNARSRVSTVITDLYTQLEHVEQIQRDRTTIDDIKRSLDLPNSEQEKARKRGEIWVIIQRMSNSTFATKKDRDNAADVAKRIESAIRSPEQPLPLHGATDAQILERMLTEQLIWSQADVKKGESLVKGVTAQTTDAERIRMKFHDQKAQVEKLTIPTGPADISEAKFRDAKGTAESLLARFRYFQTDPNKRTKDATILLEYVDKLKVQRCKQCQNTDKLQKEIDDMITKLRGFGATAPIRSNTGTTTSGDGTIESRLKAFQKRINDDDLITDVESKIEQLRTHISEESDQAVQSKYLLELKKLENALNRNKYKNDDRFKKIKQYFEPKNWTPKNNNSVDNSVIKAELENIRLANKQQQSVKEKMLANL